MFFERDVSVVYRAGFSLIQLAGDIEDLAVKFKKPETKRSMLTGTGHCSALVKVGSVVVTFVVYEKLNVNR